MRRYSSSFGSNALVQLEESDIILVDDAKAGDDENDFYADDLESQTWAPLATTTANPRHIDDLEEPLLETEAYPVGNGVVADALASPGGDNNYNCSPHAAVLDTFVEAVPLDHMRPEFLFVSIRKPEDGTIGLYLKGKQGSIRVSRIDPRGALGGAPVRPGDHVIAVNGQTCDSETTPSDVAAVVQSSVGTISFLVRNPKGHPNLFSSTVWKPTPDSKIGVAMKDVRGALVVSKVHEDGLFAGSLLESGHRCIEINGCHCNEALEALDAKAVIDYSPDLVTIISRPRGIGQALVLSCEPKSGWWRNVAIAGGLAVGALTAAQSLS